MNDILIIILVFIILIACEIAFIIIRNLTKKEINSEAQYNNDSFETLMTVLIVIINSELEEYDNEIFMDGRGITNQNFDAFYKDISIKIMNNISPKLIESLSRYTTEDNIIRIVARRTKTYLREKIKGTI